MAAPSLATCTLCGTDFVNPADWEPLDDGLWWILLRCGECETWGETTLSDDEAARFDIELDRRAEVLRRALERLDRQRMRSDVATMIAALRRDLVDAADFAR